MTDQSLPPTQLIATPVGTIIGRTNDGVTQFRGIPYARASRFELPAKQPAFSQPFEAFNRGPICPQNSSPTMDPMLNYPVRGFTQHEACQNLSITTPEINEEAELLALKLPVMFWIHGGSYTSGSGDCHGYDGADLARDNNVIVVRINYRLGLFGYLGDGDSRPANLGLLDQIAALNWVNENIASFGGDPTNVTIFGESAGGDAVLHLIAATGTDGLFRRAIIQSAPLGVMRKRDRMYAAMSRATASVTTGSSTADVLAATKLAQSVARKFGLPSLMAFGVTYGQHPLPPEQEMDERLASRASQVDILMGWNSNEVSLFTGTSVLMKKLDVLPLVQRFFRKTFEWVLGQLVYNVPARKCLKTFANGDRAPKNSANNPNSRLFQYFLDWGPRDSNYRGAHTMDLPLVFGNSEVWLSMPLLKGASFEQLEALSGKVRNIWTSFARDGFPAEFRVADDSNPGSPVAMKLRQLR